MRQAQTSFQSGNWEKVRRWEP